MVYVYKDIKGNEQIIHSETKVEEKQDIVTKEVVGYVAINGTKYVDISEEVYNAINKSRNKSLLSSLSPEELAEKIRTDVVIDDEDE